MIMQIMFYDQVAEEKANARESSYKEQIKTLTAKLKQESTSFKTHYIQMISDFEMALMNHQ